MTPPPLYDDPLAIRESPLIYGEVQSDPPGYYATQIIDKSRDWLLSIINNDEKFIKFIIDFPNIDIDEKKFFRKSIWENTDPETDYIKEQFFINTNSYTVFNDKNNTHKMAYWVIYKRWFGNGYGLDENNTKQNQEKKSWDHLGYYIAQEFFKKLNKPNETMRLFDLAIEKKKNARLLQLEHDKKQKKEEKEERDRERDREIECDNDELRKGPMCSVQGGKKTFSHNKRRKTNKRSKTNKRRKTNKRSKTNKRRKTNKHRKTNKR
jgi:hypothetical protein